MAAFSTMMILIVFRKKQREINTTVDVALTTPSDFSICIKNIPKGLKVDYKKELTKLVSRCTKDSREQKKDLNIQKITLVYDIDELEHQEHGIAHIIKEK